MIPKPVVSLHGSGESVVLSNLSSEWVLMQGSTGLGWGPQEITTAPLPQGGSVLRHRRTAQAEVMIPVLLGGDWSTRFEGRRMLERLCTDQVEIRVTLPSGDTRSRFGYYEDGLGGSYGAGEDSQDGQKLALTFTCPDPYWYGTTRTISRRVSAGRKPLITTDRRVTDTVVRTNLLTNPSLNGSVSGWSTYRSDFSYDSALGIAVSTITTADSAWVSPLQGATVAAGQAVAVKFSALRIDDSVQAIGVRIRVRDASGANLEEANSLTTVSIDAGLTEIAASRVMPAGATTMFIYLNMYASGTASAPVGSRVGLRNAIVEVGTDGPYFDGSTPPSGDAEYRWTGPVNASTSEQLAVTSSYAFPFFPILVSPSVVQGRYELEVQGDADVWPTWTITGPGKDVLISDGDGHEIFIEGEVTSPITIITRPQEQTIYDASGTIWDRVPIGRDVLFPLTPGTNSVALSMVDGTPQSQIKAEYREAYKAGV